ncbi:YdcF family protein [Clostridium sp. MD294]|uniref:YdcF family protein n=1 Tax=Clostridium sp. MD294 TaxID=97138 RepID=UPI0002CAD833|nr:YdcF family protein [Clostridium sp. MD294]NDO45869.1 YdcF family protein [Clostridium sp. MD294]USF30473.1 hypothetical protein C820_001914 [Clostridium sp. MD294]
MKKKVQKKIPLFFKILGAAGILDCLSISLVSNFNFGTLFPGGMGCIFLIYGCFYQKLNNWGKSGIGKIFMKTAKIGFCFFFISFFIITSIVILNGAKTPYKNADAIVVLGAALHGWTVSPALAQRLDTAKQYWDENDVSYIVVTGSQGPQEDRTEAEAMKEYLVTKGVPADVILIEDKAHNTRQNFTFSKQILDDIYQNENYTIVYVTNYFHTFRAGLLAEKVGFHAQGLGAPVTFYMLPNYYIREYFSVIKYFLLDSHT